MIVVDTNIISYFFLPTSFTEKATRAYETDPAWIAPQLWCSEFRNVLALYMRKGLVTFEDAISIQSEAEDLMIGNEFEIQSQHILALINNCACSAYDCEFIALAQQLSLKLLTEDKKILREFPKIAITLDQYLN